MENRTSNKLTIILVVTIIIMGFFLGRMSKPTPVIVTPTTDSLIQRLDIIRDSVQYYQDYSDSILNQNVALTIERDTLRVAVDGTLAVIDGLTDPVVTQETVTEALRWIEIYNDSLLYY